MVEQRSEPQKRPNIDIVRDLKANEQKLALHLENGESLTGTIALFDRYNLLFDDEGGKRYWVPKGAVAYAELL
ncbi:MAG: hypothetical protein ABEK03_04010 [Candidatus Bipolaricaulia bacterium]